MKGKAILPNKLSEKPSIRRVTPSTYVSQTIITSSIIKSPQISQKTSKVNPPKFIKKPKKIEIKPLDLNLTFRVKLQTSNSPKFSSGKSWKIQKESIKPLTEVTPRSSLNNYLLTIDQEAIQRPYRMSSKEEKIREVSLLSKMVYWRKKKVEQYKAAKNISQAIKTVKNKLIYKVGGDLVVKNNAKLEEASIGYEKARRFAVAGVCVEGVRSNDLHTSSPCSTNETLTPR